MNAFLSGHAKFAIILGSLLCCFIILRPLPAAADAVGNSSSITSLSNLTDNSFYYIEQTTKEATSGSNNFLDVAGGADQDGATVQIYPFNGNVSQKWRLINDGGGYYSFQSACGTSSRYLDIVAGSTASGSKVDIFGGNGTDSQKFRLVANSDGTWTIYTGTTSGEKCLDVSGSSVTPGTQIQQCDSNSTNAQKFILKKAPDIAQVSAPIISSSLTSNSVYYIRPLCSYLYLSAKAGGAINGTGITQETLSYVASQQWRINDAGNGYYTVTSVGSFTGRTLDVSGDSSNDGVPLQLYDSNKTNAQKYSIKSNGDGTFSILTGASNYSKSLDVSGASQKTGAGIQQYQANGSTAQKFVLEQIDTSLNTSSAASISSGSQYYIESAFSQLFVSTGGADNQDGTPIIQDQRNGGLSQRWIFTQNSNGSYTIINADSGKAMDVAGRSNQNGTCLQLYESNHTSAQNWWITKNSNGTFRIASDCSSGKSVIDIDSWSSQPQALLHEWTYLNQLNQDWYLIPVDGSSNASPAHIGLDSSVSGNLKNPIKLNGWSINASNIQKVSVYMDSPLTGGLIGSASIRQSSSSIQSQYPNYPGSDSAGYSFNSQLANLFSLPSGSSHTFYIVASGYDGTTSTYSYSQTYQPDFTVTAPSNNTLSKNLSFSGTVSVSNMSDISAYLNQVDNAHKITGSSTITNGQYTFNGSVDLTKANIGTNNIIVVGTEADGSSMQSGFAMNMPRPVMNVDDPTSNTNVNGSTLQIDGWAMNYSGAQPQINILIDGKTQKAITPSVSRPDVFTANNYPTYLACNSSQNVGFDTTVNVSSLSSGSHTLTVQFTGDGGTVVSRTIPFTIPSITYKPMNISLTTLYNDNVSAGALPSSTSQTVLDPNYLFTYDSVSRYEFLSLNWIDGVTVDDLNSMLKNSGCLAGHGQDFLNAAKTYNINPVYLVAHANLETGYGGTTSFSRLVSGIVFQNGKEFYKNSSGGLSPVTLSDTSSTQVTGTLVSGSTYAYTDSHGKTYNVADGTYYNLWGIHAYDGYASRSGGIWAGYQNWNSIGAAIAGGAQWIAANYTTGQTYSQITLYEMKWDPYGWATYGSAAEYATDFNSITDNWAYDVAKIIAQHADIFQHTASPKFYIPQYN